MFFIYCMALFSVYLCSYVFLTKNIGPFSLQSVSYRLMFTPKQFSSGDKILKISHNILPLQVVIISFIGRMLHLCFVRKQEKTLFRGHQKCPISHDLTDRGDPYFFFHILMQNDVMIQIRYKNGRFSDPPKTEIPPNLN